MSRFGPFTTLLSFLLGLCACVAPTPSQQDSILVMQAWQGRTQTQVQDRFGKVDHFHQQAHGRTRVGYEQLWVLGAGGERYRTLQADYPVRGAGGNKEPGGFNAKVLRCLYQFEWGPDHIVVAAQVTGLGCPIPSP